MAQLEDKQAFSNRLNHALDMYGVPPKGKGRQVTVGKMFGVSQKAANKWLEASSLPDTMRIATIAETLGVNVEWLTYGAGPINNEPLPGNPGSRWKRVPLITWEEAGNFEKFNMEQATKWTWTDIECSPRTYALQVTDDSMSPRYEEGATLIIDFERAPKHRDIVIFRWNKTGDVSCAQYLIDGPNEYLKPHNPDYKTALVNDGDVSLRGTARQVLMTY